LRVSRVVCNRLPRACNLTRQYSATGDALNFKPIALKSSPNDNSVADKNTRNGWDATRSEFLRGGRGVLKTVAT